MSKGSTSNPTGVSARPSLWTRLTLFLETVKFEHTVFALPFAYVAVFLAADGFPSASDFV